MSGRKPTIRAEVLEELERALEGAPRIPGYGIYGWLHGTGAFVCSSCAAALIDRGFGDLLRGWTAVNLSGAPIHRCDLAGHRDR